MGKKKRIRFFRNHFRHVAPPGTAPGTLVSHPDAQPTRLRMMAYDPDRLVEREIRRAEEVREFLGRWPVVWVRVEGLKDVAVLSELGTLFSLHPLILEDIINLHQRPKVEEYDANLFLVTRRSHANEKLDLEQISLVLGPGFVLSFQERSNRGFQPVEDRIRSSSGKRLRLSRPDYLVYALLDTVVDSYFPVLEAYSERLDEYEDRVIADPSRAMIDQIHDLKRDFLLLRRAVWPQRDAVNVLTRERELITDDTRVYLRDCYDHVVQVMDILEGHRERASDLLNIYLTSISNKTNEIMKVLTVIATVFMPLGFVAGVYGMNFERDKSPLNMPELGWYWGYPFALGLMAAIAASLLVYFRRKGWLGGEPPTESRGPAA